MRVWVSPETLNGFRKLEAECWRSPDHFDGGRWYLTVAVIMLHWYHVDLSKLPPGETLDLVVDWSLGVSRWRSRGGK